MFWFVQLAISVAASWAIGKLTPKPKAEKPTPGAVDPDQMPTVTEARAIPMIWGTVNLRGLNVLWYGNHVATPAPGGGRPTVAYFHWLTVAYGLCCGEIDRVVSLSWDDLTPVPTAYTPGPAQSWDVISFPPTNQSWDLFGGYMDGGGISGEFRCYRGGTPQTPDDGLEAQIGTDLPGWPGMAWILACNTGSTGEGFTSYIGTSPVLHPLSAIVRRIDNANPLAFVDAVTDLDGDANPANILWDILTNADAALGLTESDGLDKDSFVEAGNFLAEEAFGLSMVLTDAAAAQEAIGEILRHIDGVLVTNARTGFLELRLIRDDYDPLELPVLGPDQIRSLTFQRPSMDATADTVRVVYTDRDDHYTERVVALQNPASIQTQGQITVQDIAFPLVTKALLAQKLVAREARLLSYPWAKITLTTDRTAWELRPGSPFKLTWPDLGITGMVCRVTRINLGELLAGDIEIEAAEDVFGAGWTAYGPLPPNGWTDPYVPA